MIECKRILAVVDAERDNQPALSRAYELASKTGASVTAMMVVYDLSYDMTTMLSPDEREAMRDAVTKEHAKWLATHLQEQGFTETDIVVEWNNRSYESIIYYTLNNQIDLVVKATKKHDDLASVIFTPTDWHLMRKCPRPVLLVKEHGWPEGGEIIAAVNVGSEDDEHAALNDKLTVIANDYASLLKGSVNLVNSYPSTPLNIAIEVPEFDPDTYHDAVKNHHLKEMRSHALKYGIPEDKCVVREGLPEKVIPQVAKALDAELVVIGTVGRVGISAALIGNTAEHVIDELNCDVLAIKPDGFVSPLSV
ncbi:universal stress protein E [Alteromonas macleodii]|jgi:universal stress protein E|uniref:Universal stress protein UspE n=1 Tax=Alteromonas australica TaxID=589873 RepID=A0A358DY97_9ALTE|nr:MULTISPECIES: universal stress protein UspE [Alteromonas]AFT78488.1 universal stress protein UspE [Alteromonas macleodii str. 'Black Sea 11']MEC8298549.1 universal stress protein UspE [Pseudomonadota bacterium]NKW90256.1 universal stress protein UspE [Alteromonadaceae bacterium A_SAG4]NKX04121.1 universal stress protein UspE [Alteromonadaceae bacterium A_SAG6]NKX35873.1 universal stress protein UspE [Alteromonadaceae bacterium A_SAG3]|tara:strand:- start:408 stop:1331 length:924 start_codon:yes stop_codon:yes gene_type:complete